MCRSGSGISTAYCENMFVHSVETRFGCVSYSHVVFCKLILQQGQKSVKEHHDLSEVWEWVSVIMKLCVYSMYTYTAVLSALYMICMFTYPYHTYKV